MLQMQYVSSEFRIFLHHIQYPNSLLYTISKVDIVKKANRWVCKLCGEKQTLRKDFGQGSGEKCRIHAQQLNLARRDAESNEMPMMAHDETNQNELPNSGCHQTNSDTGESFENSTQQNQGCSKWNLLLDEDYDENDDRFRDGFIIAEESRFKKIKCKRNNAAQTSPNHQLRTEFEEIFDKPILKEGPSQCEKETLKKDFDRECRIHAQQQNVSRKDAEAKPFIPMIADEANQNEFSNKRRHQTNSDTRQSYGNTTKQNQGCSNWNPMIDDDDENDDCFRDSFKIAKHLRPKQVKLKQANAIRTESSHRTEFEEIFEKCISIEEPLKCKTLTTSTVKNEKPTVVATTSKWSEFVDSEEDD